MWSWFNRTRNGNRSNVTASSSRAHPFAVTPALSDAEDGNDSDVGLLIAFDSDTAEPAVDGVLLLQDEDAGQTEATHQSCQLSACNIPQSSINTEAVVVEHNVVSSSSARDEASRRRRRRRHHHHSSSNRRRERANRIGNKDSNFLSAACNLVVVVLTSIAIFEPRWFHIQGGHCTDGRRSVNYLGIKSFFSPSNEQQDQYAFGDYEVLLGCVTPNVIVVMRVIIGLCFMVLISSVTACILDIAGSSRLVLKLIQTTASLSILSVCVCITISGMCYLATEQLTEYYISNRLHEGSRVIVEFDIGFYMVTAAGALSVIAVGCALLRVPSRTTSASSSSSSSSRLRNVSWEPIGSHQSDEQLIDAAASRMFQAAAESCPPNARAPPPYRP